MKKNVIVSLADSNYFPLLNELIDSIKRFKESSEVAICILDAGLSDDQKTELSSKVDEIKTAEWDIKVPDSKIKGREWLRAKYLGLFCPNIFQAMKNICGLIVTLGSMIGNQLSFILKRVKMVS